MEDNKKDKKPLNIDKDHPLKTRRDFLAQGLLASAATMVLPFDAMAQDGCDLASITAVDNPMIPVIILDLAGGSNIAGSNVIVGGANGQMDYLPDYKTVGLLSNEHPSIAGKVSDLTGNTTSPSGLLFHSQSQMLAGIMSQAPLAVRQRTDGILLCCSSDDDTGNNPHNPMYWFYKAGARGKLTQLIGSQGGQSGGNSQAPSTSVDLSVAPLTINEPKDVTNLVGLGRQGFTTGRESFILRALDSLSNARVSALSRRQMPDAVKDLVLCNVKKTEVLLQNFNPTLLDPVNDANVTAVFTNIAGDGNQRKAASVCKMVLDGLAATGTITLGGFDYHTGDRVTGDQRDREAGEMIGKILAVAARKNTPVVVYVFTDGGVSAGTSVDGANGRLVWGGDNGQRSGSVMLAYNPTGKPQMRSNSRQMGRYKVGASVDNSATPMSNSVTNLAKSVVLNYLALHGMENDLDKVVGDNPFAANINQHLFFRKIA
ncbi:MAG: hypothetical protein K2P81_05360 [Bacteriovoracaceae bacterium]|nr:hypothetical protein [Bacteriovoracaceae bacterium]